MKALILAACAVTLAGCGTDMAELNREPVMSRVGSGLAVQRDAIPLGTPPGRGVDVAFNSIYTRQSEDLFRDTRAMKTGDVVTVKISIKDKATLDNNSKRSRDSKTSLKPKIGYDFQTTGGLNHNGDLSVDVEAEGETSTDSKGGITRSEKIELLIAAVVTGVLPNGNLIVSGSQEVRVNYEVRELSVAGIVRPRDIATDNSVEYDKVAEARISYGGRGRITEVQQPAVGQQLFDLLTPF